jgi:hypothetical protein
MTIHENVPHLGKITSLETTPDEDGRERDDIAESGRVGLARPSHVKQRLKCPYM